MNIRRRTSRRPTSQQLHTLRSKPERILHDATMTPVWHDGTTNSLGMKRISPLEAKIDTQADLVLCTLESACQNYPQVEAVFASGANVVCVVGMCEYFGRVEAFTIPHGDSEDLNYQVCTDHEAMKRVVQILKGMPLAWVGVYSPQQGSVHQLPEHLLPKNPGYVRLPDVRIEVIPDRLYDTVRAIEERMLQNPISTYGARNFYVCERDPAMYYLFDRETGQELGFNNIRGMHGMIARLRSMGRMPFVHSFGNHLRLDLAERINAMDPTVGWVQRKEARIEPA